MKGVTVKSDREGGKNVATSLRKASEAKQNSDVMVLSRAETDETLLFSTPSLASLRNDRMRMIEPFSYNMHLKLHKTTFHTLLTFTARE